MPFIDLLVFIKTHPSAYLGFLASKQKYSALFGFINGYGQGVRDTTKDRTIRMFPERFNEFVKEELRRRNSAAEFGPTDYWGDIILAEAGDQETAFDLFFELFEEYYRRAERELIETAFAEAKYPGDDRLVCDQSGAYLESTEVAATFRGKHWKEVPFETLRLQSAGLSFFTAEAYRFYFPAYLLAVVFHYNEAHTILDSIVVSLISPSDLNHAQMYRQRIEGFTPTERKATASFFEFLKRHYPDDRIGDLDKALAIFSP